MRRNIRAGAARRPVRVRQPDARAAGERSEQVLTVACNVDGIVVPVAQPIVATLGPPGAAAQASICWCIPRWSRHARQLSGVPASATPVSPAETAPPEADAKPAP